MVLRVITVMLLLFPLTAFSQNSLYRLTPGKSALGMSISFLENEKNLSGYLTSPIDHSTQAIFGVGIGLLDNEPLKGTGDSIPPSPSGVVALKRTSALGTTGLQSFLTGGVGASSAKRVRTEDNMTLRSVVGLRTFGGAGIFKRLKTSSELVMTSSFGVYYAYTWRTAEDKILSDKKLSSLVIFQGALACNSISRQRSVCGAH